MTSVAEVKRALEARGLDASELRPIGTRLPLGDYILQLWERRHFIWMDARHRAATQNARNRLGNLWLILRPMVDASFYFVIFGLLLGARAGVENFPAFIVIGILMYRSTSSAIGAGAGTLNAGKAMIRAFNFPRAAIVIAASLRDILTSAITVAITCCVIIVIPPFAPPQLTWTLVPVLFVIHSFMNTGIRFITARIGFYFPDMTQVLGVVSRFLMYGSGVMFPIERFVDHPSIMAIIEINPLYQIIDMYRTVLIDGQIPEPDAWLITLAWTIGFAFFGFIYFWKGEASYGRELR
ncbi:ABC transporter permease [Brachybacterium sp. DNPG3]